VKPSMIGRWRPLVGRVDQFCGRWNGGLTAVAIVLAIIISLTVAYRTVHTLRVPEGYEIAAKT
jgi:hypothetical protein